MSTDPYQLTTEDVEKVPVRAALFLVATGYAHVDTRTARALLNRLLSEHAHELAEKIRYFPFALHETNGAEAAADRIDPEVLDPIL